MPLYLVRVDILEKRGDETLGCHLSNFLEQGIRGKELLCLIDGEHYPPVTKATINRLEEMGNKVSALVFLGGSEKLENAEMDFRERKVYVNEGEVEETIPNALNVVSADLVVDLSDEPIVDYFRRFRIGSRVLIENCSYIGADFYFDPPHREEVLEKPNIGIIGTGKRVGKTAVSIHLARLLFDQGIDPAIVCMGRGGPPEPEVVNLSGSDVGVEKLLEISKSGSHAASDHWEDAFLSRVLTIGCRRCGGGMSGNPFMSNVIEGARITNSIPQDFVIMEGSGPTLPPVETEKNILVIGADQPIDTSVRMFGEYRILLSDFIIITKCEEPMASEQKLEDLRDSISEIDPEIDIALTIFRPEPMGDIGDKRVFVTTTSKGISWKVVEDYLEGEFGCEVCGTSDNLSDRKILRKELKEGLEGCEVLLTEVKAASIDLAAMKAREKGLEVVLMNNKPLLVGGTIDDLDSSLLSVCK